MISFLINAIKIIFLLGYAVILKSWKAHANDLIQTMFHNTKNKKPPRSRANRNEAGTAGQMAIQCGK